MKIITVTGFKGGVGKSTAAIHLAAYFSELGRTLLVDGDPNHTSIAWAQGGKLPFDVVTTNQVARAVQNRDFVIFDTPARPNSEDLSEMVGSCDLLILPTTPDIVSIRPMIATIQELGEANYRTLVSIVPPRPMKDGELAQKELKELGFPVFDTMIRRSVVFTKAATANIVVRDLEDPRGALAWEDYRSLGKEIQEILS
jgi:chromosome partitioning protein